MNAPLPAATLMSGDDYRESLRRYRRGCSSTAAASNRWPTSAAAAGHQCHRADLRLRAEAGIRAADDGGAAHQRQAREPLTHINTSAGDLLNKLEAVRLVCQETGCAQRYLTHDALNAIGQVSGAHRRRARHARAHRRASWPTCTACRTRT
jgi:4-hydroxybutyryl-CoA dehydratase/vinylacetyl-CoA-Delta-isomerase